MAQGYVDLDIDIEQAPGPDYRVRVTDSVTTQKYTETLRLPTDDPRYTLIRSKLEDGGLVSEAKLLEFSQLVGETLLTGKIGTAFQNARTHAAQQGKNIRLKLNITPEQIEIATFPWEFAADDSGYPLATQHSICRLIPTMAPLPPFDVQGSIKLLLASASPTGKQELDIDAERAGIREALQPLIDKRQIQIIEIEHLTTRKLQRAITSERPHIIHYIGHGIFADGTGYLALEHDDGTLHKVSATQLGSIFRNSGVKLVVLNACHSGTISTNLLRGIAPALLRADVPAVVGMQSSVLDKAGRAFAEEFYFALSQGQPIDGCVAEGRKAIIASGLEQLDWGLATLYMRARDGQLFAQPEAKSETAAPQPQRSDGGTNISFGTGANISGSNISIGNIVGGNLNQSSGSHSAPAPAPVGSANEPNQLEHLRQLRAQLQHDLNALELQEAKFGSLYVPVHITTQIRETRERIARLDAQIRQSGGEQ